MKNIKHIFTIVYMRRIHQLKPRLRITLLRGLGEGMMRYG